MQKKQPSLREEKRPWRKGFKRVACLDEAGRGPLAGPVVAVAVIVKNSKLQAPNYKQIQNANCKSQNDNPKFKIGNVKRCQKNTKLCFEFRASDLKLRDSKKLTPKAREKFYKILTTHPGIWWAIGKVSAKVIDKINILEATKLAMKRAINNLEKKYSPVDFLILDGKMKLNLPIPQKSIVKADQKVFSCAVASIIAKVTRDRIMEKYHKKYPQYGFDKHKGYPTKYHQKMLKKYGPSVIHRLTFAPLKKMGII